ncbi:mitochondrial fission ELM1 family protein [Parvularcula marina]|uniref:mitochondrial fission ELM1 family protein n=1 Tax=Parvularcula marina TaxID=2292771 RepID=UPI003513FFC4
MGETPLLIWAVSDGRAGMENQVMGLAEAVARLTPAYIERKRIAIRAPFDKLPRMLMGPSLSRLSADSDSLDPPWPDLWIGCGRRVVPLSIEMKRHVPMVVQTQDPRARLGGFDLVIPPEHDELKGDNVFPILGSPNRLEENRLRTEAGMLIEDLGLDEDQRYAAVLIGGDSKDYQMTGPVITLMLEALAAAEDEGYRLLITPSRRTPEFVKHHLREALPDAWIWDGEPVGRVVNPYFGMLGVAERFYVTGESANMLTDAAFTGKPIHMLPLEGGAPKWQRFHQALEDRHILKPHCGPDDQWTYEPLRETDRAAAEILRRMGR